MKPSIGWLVHVGLAGTCLIWVGCGGGSDVPDPDSDSKAASASTTTAPPPTIVANNEEAPPPASEPNKEAPPAEGAATTEPPASEGAASGKSDGASSTNEMLALSGTPNSSGSGEKTEEGAEGSTSSGSDSAASSGGGMTPGTVPQPGGRPGGRGMMPGNMNPGAGSSPGGMAGGMPGMPGPGAMGGRAAGGPGAMGPAGDGPGGGGMAGMGGTAADNGPADFSSPTGGVNAFLKALRKKDAAALAEATALHAPTEAAERNRRMFEQISRQELDEEGLSQLAQKLEGFQIQGSNHPKSSNTIGITLRKRGDATTMLTRTIMVRKEKAGWKVVDIGGQSELDGPLMIRRRR